MGFGEIMVTHGCIPTENNPAPSNDPVRTGEIHHAIKKAMPMSPLQEFSRPLAGRGGITPPISNLFSYPSSAPTKLKRATPQVNQTTFARFDSLYRASPSPKWMTCSKIPHREREQHMASPALGQKSSCLTPPTADNGRVAEVLQSTFSSRITSASIELRGKNATNENGNAVTSNIPQCNLKQTNDLHGSEELSDKGNSHVIKEKSVRTETERGGEGVIEVVESEEIIENNPKQDRVVEASSSAEPGKIKGSIVVIQPPEDKEVNDEQQKQDGVVVEANNIFGDQNTENDQSNEKNSPKGEFSMTNEEELEEEKISSRVIEQQGKGKDTVVVDQNAEGMEESYSSNCKKGVRSSSTHLEQNGEKRRRTDLSSSVDSKIVSEGNNNDIGTSALVREKVEFSSTQIESRESSPIADRRASLRSAVVPPCVLVSAMQSQKKTVLPKQHGFGKVVLSAKRGEVILRDWFVIAVLDENENSTTQEQPVSTNRKEEIKYRLCGDLVTYQSNNTGSRLPPVISGVILSRQASKLVRTEDGDLYRLEGECGAAREGTDNNNGIWTSDASEAFRSGFPVYWRSTLRQLLLQRDANKIKEEKKYEEEVKLSSTAENVAEGRKQDLPEIKDRTTVRQHHILAQNQDAGGADTTHHCDKITSGSKLPLASVALDEKANPKQQQQQSSPRQLRRRWQPPPQQEGGQQLKRKLPTTKPKPNPIKQKKTKMKQQKKNQPQRLPSSSHHIISGSSPVVKQKKTKQQQLHSTSHLQCTSRPPPAAKRSSPLRITSRRRSSNIEDLVTKQGPPPLMSRKSKKEPMRLALMKKQQISKKTSNSPPSIKTTTTIRSVTPQRTSIRKSRSGRHIVSSLEWWKGERLMSMRPGLQGSPVVTIGRGEINEYGGGLNSNSKGLKKNALIGKKKKSSCTDGGVTGSGRGNKTTTTTIARVGSITKAAGSRSSTKQSHKNMRVVVSSSLKKKQHNDKEIKIKAESTTSVRMKMMCQKQKSSVLHQQEGRIQQMPHHPASG